MLKQVKPKKATGKAAMKTGFQNAVLEMHSGDAPGAGGLFSGGAVRAVLEKNRSRQLQSLQDRLRRVRGGAGQRIAGRIARIDGGYRARQ